MQTRSKTKKKFANKRKAKADTSDEDEDYDCDQDMSDASSVEAKDDDGDYTESASDSDVSIATKKKATKTKKNTKKTKIKKTKTNTKKSKTKTKTSTVNKRHKSDKHENMDNSDDDDDDDDDNDTPNLMFETDADHNRLPEPVTYLAAVSDSDCVVKPDPRLFDILNGDVRDYESDSVDAINAYMAAHDDSKIERTYFSSSQTDRTTAVPHGMLNMQLTESLYLRHEAFEKVMASVDDHIADMIRAADETIFNDIVTFVQRAYTAPSHDDESPTPMHYLRAMQRHKIPTAMLMCGQNVSDHPLHFEHLYRALGTDISPLIVRITQDNLKQTGSMGARLYELQRYIFESVLENVVAWKVQCEQNKQQSQLNSADAGGGDGGGESSNKQRRKCRQRYEQRKLSETEHLQHDELSLQCRKSLSIPNLSGIRNEILRTFTRWYFTHSELIYKHWPHNDALRSCLSELPKIVVVIDCIEHCPPQLLSSIIYTLHGLTDGARHVPFVLVLGASSTELALSRMVESDALRLLSVSRYYFEPSHILYKQLAEDILIERAPILFDCGILHKLLSHYQLNDYSVARFKDQIRYLFMSYFMNTRASQYAAFLMYLQQQQQHDKDEDEDEDQEEEDGRSNRREIETKCNEWWFDAEEELIMELLRTTDFNEGETFELWRECLTQSVFPVYKRYRDALKVFKMISDHLQLAWDRTQIIAQLQNKTSLFQHLLSRLGADDTRYKLSNEQRASGEFAPRIADFHELHQIYLILEEKTKKFDPEISKQAKLQYAHIMTQLQSDKTSTTATAAIAGAGDRENENENENQNVSNKLQRRPMNKSKQKRLGLKRSLTAQTKKGLYEESRNKLFALLKTFIEKHLKPMHELPLHRVFVYGNAELFCEDMFPPSSSTMRRRWQQPLDTECNEPEPMCCIYSVYELSEQFINLHDAYVSFKHQLCGDNDDDDDDDDEDGDSEDENENGDREKFNHIQFRMSMDDLRFCGFVKATNRRKEVLVKTAELL